MFAYLVDRTGKTVKRLEDIPITLTENQQKRGYWQFPVASEDGLIAYDVVNARIEDFIIESAARIRVFAFTDEAQHRAILDFMQTKI